MSGSSATARAHLEAEKHPAPMSATEGFPGGARFAFTILDDTDDATVENVRPLYDLLSELGLRTTKTVWPLDCPEGSDLYFAGQTLRDAEYRAFVRELVARGFEIASHGATMESSVRARTVRGLQYLRDTLGVVPVVHCNHGHNRENLYWGAERYRTPWLRFPLLGLERLVGRPRYSGHVPGSPYFWGDVCREQFQFVRNFAFATLNSGAIPPSGPYRLSSTPWVNYWFNTSDAPDVWHFKRLVTPQAIDRLIAEGGSCILSTHLGKGFVRHGRVDAQVEDVLRYIAARPGWFAPVSEILGFQLSRHSRDTLAPWTRWRLELHHIADRVRSRVLPPPSRSPSR
jgi:hypothetical protein